MSPQAGEWSACALRLQKPSGNLQVGMSLCIAVYQKWIPGVKKYSCEFRITFVFLKKHELVFTVKFFFDFRVYKEGNKIFDFPL